MTQYPKIGLLPAAGQASRIAPLPCSKELYPVGFRAIDVGAVASSHSQEAGNQRPKAVCHYILEKMQLAGVEKTFIVLRSGKWDIPAYLGDGAILSDGPSKGRSMHLAYLMMRLPYGAPYTIDQAYPFVQDALIVFGFPDILFEPQNAFVQLVDHQAATGADVVLGLFPSDQPYKMDMVELDEQGAVRNIVIKPPETDLRYTWIIAVWTPTFTQYMHDYLAAALAQADSGRADQGRADQGRADQGRPESGPELYVGDVIQAAIDDDLQVKAVCFDNGLYLDIGTPGDLMRAVRQGGRLQ